MQTNSRQRYRERDNPLSSDESSETSDNDEKIKPRRRARISSSSVEEVADPEDVHDSESEEVVSISDGDGDEHDTSDDIQKLSTNISTESVSPSTENSITPSSSSGVTTGAGKRRIDDLRRRALTMANESTPTRSPIAKKTDQKPTPTQKPIPTLVISDDEDVVVVEEKDQEKGPMQSGPSTSAPVQLSARERAIQAPVKTREGGVQLLSSNVVAGLIATSNKNKALTSGRNFGGENIFTHDVIQRMHSEITTAPVSNVRTPTPDGIICELMPHQKTALAWLLWRETQRNPGGILADDMGLGKTLTIIALIVETKNRRLAHAEQYKKWQNEIFARSKLIPSNATLVVAPASLIGQWEKEVRDRCKRDLLRVCVFHGPQRDKYTDKALARCDIVVTTYGTLQSELTEKIRDDRQVTDNSDSDADSGAKAFQTTTSTKKTRDFKFSTASPLANVAWQRIVLDEAHTIKNPSTQMARAAYRLPALARWALTGTPIHNAMRDFFSLVKFLRIAPFNEEKTWKDYMDAKDQHSAKRLQTLVKAVVLRRTKDQIDSETNKPLVELPPKQSNEVRVTLGELEGAVYLQMFTHAQKQVARMLANMSDRGDPSMYRQLKKSAAETVNPFVQRGGGHSGSLNNWTVMLVLILRLRQAAVHMCLTREAVNMDAFKDDGEDMELNQTLANLSLEDSSAQDDEANEKKSKCEELFQEAYVSSKMGVVLDAVNKVLDTNDKCVIVSQWSSLLDLFARQLNRKRVRVARIDGKVQIKERQPRVDDFNSTHPDSARVMLLSLTAGGVGLNLTGGNHLFLVDLHWNPMLEQQAADRIYRMGQKKKVFVHKFITDGTIEDRVHRVQQTKRELAETVLSGAKQKMNLSVNDIKLLFDLQRPKATATAAQKQPVPSMSSAM